MPNGGQDGMKEELFNVILTLIPVLGAVITYYILPCIRANLDSAKLAQYQKWTSLAVETAEMLWQESGSGNEKLAYVVSFLNDMFNKNKVRITDEQLRVLIESCIKQMKTQENKQSGGSL